MMKKSYFLLMVTAFCAFFVGCGTMSSPSKNSTTPETAGQEFEVPPYTTETLENGLRVIWIEDNQLPRFSMTLMIEGGALVDPSFEQRGLTRFTTAMLEKGSQSRTATEIAQDFEFYGTQFLTSVSEDAVFLSTSGLVQHQKELLNGFLDVLMRPRFEQSEINRIRKTLLSGLKKIEEDPGDVASLEYRRLVLPQFPSGQLSEGSAEFLNSVNRKQLVDHFQKYFRPQLSWLVFMGQMSEETKKIVRNEFGQWKMNEVISPAPRDFGSVINNHQPQKVKKVKADLKQAQIRIGFPSVSRSHPDFQKLRLANLILGGGFQSRLNQRIRDDLGLTYSISSSHLFGFDYGLFTISTFTKNEQVDQVVSQVRNEFKKIVDEGITQTELDQARTMMIAQFPSALESPEDLARNLLVLRRNRIEDSYLSEFRKHLIEISKDEVNAAIRRHWSPGGLTEFVYLSE